MTAPAVTHTVQELELATGLVSYLTGGSGPPAMVLHHDVGAFGWSPFLESLAQSHTVYAPDLPGWGASPRLEWARHPRDLAAVILNFCRRLELDNYTLVGLGFGGWVALEMAAFAPDRMSALVLAAPAGLRPDEGFILDQILAEQVAYLREGFSSQEVFDEQFPDPKDRALRDQLDKARENVARVSWKPYMYSYELPELLRGLELPVSILWGAEDRVIPPATAAQFAAILPNASVRLLPARGHFLDFEAPDELAGAVTAATSAAGKD